MWYLHDVWTNFSHKKKRGFEVPEYHEWNKGEEDKIQMLDQVPLVKVSSELFIQIRDTILPLPMELLEQVENKGYLMLHYDKIPQKYLFAVSDGFDSLLIDTEGTLLPIRKSKLIPRQHQLVMELVETDKPTFTESVLTKEELEAIQHHYRVIAGMTRVEKERFLSVMNALDEIKEEENLAKLRYLYMEFNYEGYLSVMDNDFPTLFHLLVQEVKENKCNDNLQILSKLLGTVKNEKSLV